MVLDEFDHDLTATGMMLRKVGTTIPGRYSIALFISGECL